MKLRLVKACEEYRSQITDMLDEWNATGEKIIPYAIRRLDYHDFEYYCENLEVKDESQGMVPDSTFFCLDEERNIIVGAVNIRHYLNEALLLNGGHIGDGIRPSERRKGYATAMIGLALEECKKLGIFKVLMVCYKDNIGSAKSIQNNGGILENEINVEGKMEQRYWIDLEQKITLCGDNCIECPRYNAHTAEELRAVAELWFKVGWRNHIVSNEEIACEGCSSHKNCTYQLVECTKNHCVTKCNQCNEFPCSKIKAMLERTEEYKRTCKELCSEQEYEVLHKAFFEKEENLKK